ncbi:MAG TPA: STAS domain-containing protein [Acidimicrobiia bacterium]|nr:STAS domain-containing protein [Acidimicrobiia bacterium]
MGRRREERTDSAPLGLYTAVDIGRVAGADPDRPGPEPEPAPGRRGASAAADDAHALRITVEEGPPVVLHVAGDLDLHTSPQLADRLDAVGEGDVVVDCEHLRFVDSIGVSLLVRIAHELRAEGRTLALRNVSSVPHRTLEILGLTEMLGVRD